MSMVKPYLCEIFSLDTSPSISYNTFQQGGALLKEVLSIDITTTKLFNEFYRIIANEKYASNGVVTMPNCPAPEVLGIVQQLECVIKSSFVPRCCTTRYGHFPPKQLAPESVSAHTNLMQVIIDRVLSYEYGPYFEKTEDGFVYREIMEVARRHDLPENAIGDIADNGNRNDKELARAERAYLRAFAQASPSREAVFEDRVRQLQCNMDEKRGFSGRLLYAADKVSAILVTLGYDAEDQPPTMTTNFEDASAKETKSMALCEFRTQKTGKIGEYEICKASEMWTIDYFKIRKLYQYDDTGLITAILVMYSLVVNGKWYAWREADYES